MKMTKSTSLAFAAVLFAAVTSIASANSLTLTQYSLYSYSDGGEFTVTSSDAQLQTIQSLYGSKAIVNGGFEVFCLEDNQYFNNGGTYSYGISDAAIPGGVSGGVNGRDPVSLGSAWLYTQFAAGTLANYNYTAGVGRENSAGLLQKAIWSLDGEITTATTANNIFLQAAATQYGSVAAAEADNNGTFNVGAINLGTNSENQDQIVLRPVPDGGVTIALFGAALLGLGLMRKRFRS